MKVPILRKALGAAREIPVHDAKILSSQLIPKKLRKNLQISPILSFTIENSSGKTMGDHVTPIDMKMPNGRPVLEIPFGTTVTEIESVRFEIDSLRANDSSETFERDLLALETKLRDAYAKLAAKAATKVAMWKPGPKLK
ncbi:hypothetical protein PVT71_13515 [Salipiger sp. H15]|uniref:Uncharacterized protein n=1 Tax=Alloyangia sp. H15 TaxID=3029062 RepID=A0AAU8AFG3_9RHOB